MKQKDFEELLESVKEGGRILRGVQEPSRRFDHAQWVNDIRQKLNKTQKEFAELIQVPVSTVRNWEQGRRVPKGPAIALLKLVSSLPKRSLQILQQ
jgi:putative transcriptional regulator